MSQYLPSWMRAHSNRSRGLRYKPRFTVGSVTGWTIPNTILNSMAPFQRSKGPCITTAYVYDSANCYLPVAQFNPARYSNGKARDPLAEATKLAKRLNDEEREWRRGLR